MGEVTYPIYGTEPPDPRYDLGQGASGAGAFFGQMLGDRIRTKRLSRQLNPMREAMIQSQAGIDRPRTTQEQMILQAAQDPVTFARMAGSPEGALKLGGVVSGQPRTREIIVHGGDELNTKLG